MPKLLGDLDDAFKEFRSEELGFSDEEFSGSILQLLRVGAPAEEIAAILGVSEVELKKALKTDSGLAKKWNSATARRRVELRLQMSKLALSGVGRESTDALKFLYQQEVLQPYSPIQEGKKVAIGNFFQARTLFGGDKKDPEDE